MNRLEHEHQRLYLPMHAADGRVHGMVLAVALPAGWDALAAVWRGVQVDLELPAPAIAVDGREAYQLWFSLHEPVALPQALAFLQGLCARYLAGTRPERIRMFPDALGSAPPQPPPQRVAPDRWSAFVAADLAPLFADDRCLDQPPGEEAQADLLSRMQAMKPEFFHRACAQLAADAEAARAAALAASVSAAAAAAGAAVSASSAGSTGSSGSSGSAPATPPALELQPASAASSLDAPRRFLLAVMQDPAIDMHLRIEAAKALLQAPR